MGVGLGQRDEVVEEFGIRVGGYAEDFGIGSGESVGEPHVGAAATGSSDDEVEWLGEFLGCKDEGVNGCGGASSDRDAEDGFALGFEIALDLVGAGFEFIPSSIGEVVAMDLEQGIELGVAALGESAGWFSIGRFVGRVH